MSCVILMYHVIDEPRAASEARFCCPPEMFRAQMEHLSSTGWRVIALSELARHIERGQAPPERSVVITFDDGTACTHEFALPILAEFGYPAAVFIVSHLIGGINDWMVREGQPERKMLSNRQVVELRDANIEIGSHTAHHVWMTRVSPDEAKREALESKARLEELLGSRVVHFAYPYGNHNRDVQRIVHDAGYKSACSTRAGKIGRGTDMLSLRRVEIRGDDALWQFRVKLIIGTNDVPPWSLARTAVKKILGIDRKTGI